MGYCDFKVSWLLIKLGRPFIYDGMQEFAELITEFIEENPRYLRQAVMESDIRTS